MELFLWVVSVLVVVASVWFGSHISEKIFDRLNSRRTSISNITQTGVAGRQMIIKGAKGGITVNGQSYSGSNMTIINGQVFIDGVEVTQTGALGSVINVVVNGGCDSVETTAGDITVNGVTNSVKTTSGDVEVRGDVGGSVNSVSGDIEVGGSIKGSVKTVSGDISR